MKIISKPTLCVLALALSACSITTTENAESKKPLPKQYEADSLVDEPLQHGPKEIPLAQLNATMDQLGQIPSKSEWGWKVQQCGEGAVIKRTGLLFSAVDAQ